MGTTFSLRDLGVLPGQARSEDLQLELVSYVQGGVAYAVDGGTVPATLDITAMPEGESFRLRFTATFTGPCARCLEPASVTVNVDEHIVHDPDSDVEQLRSEHVDDAAVQLDLTGWAQEQVALRFPSRMLCNAECRGLCGECGASLNDDPDHRHERPTDSRWDALKALQLDAAAESDPS